MRDKRMTADQVVGELADGMTVGIGGWGSRRKPMALVKAILRSPLRDLTVVAYGGPDLGMLCAAGKVRRAVYGFVSLDSIPYDPWFQQVRQRGGLEVSEVDEGMLQTGLRAAGHRLPFLPIRAGLASDVLRLNPDLRLVECPYTGEELLAMPALPLDAALVHLNLADPHGNARYLGPDPYFDDLFCLAAARRYVSCEQVVDTAALVAAGPPQGLLLNRMMVDGVIEAPGGAGFTSCVPDYDRDEQAQRAYATAAREQTWESFVDSYLREV
ncbi:acyl CoA--acetate/3-ketoacid CoA transferase subunit alpha [Crossiella sp. CA-258035]|uniref:CoA transferase subunit A n=1 Tax=Crossiella sp. CA-258035 TaxID=2981138 RepID=UPI0024BC48E2|nr:CoA-transferase [Crossiella sp. CA-258035]WHT21963.1 acyl CoA--acetate/3-ketoacid CoA transferase subunit alpha [Crossiella sp. CA-258035]